MFSFLSQTKASMFLRNFFKADTYWWISSTDQKRHILTIKFIYKIVNSIDPAYLACSPKYLKQILCFGPPTALSKNNVCFILSTGCYQKYAIILTTTCMVMSYEMTNHLISNKWVHVMACCNKGRLSNRNQSAKTKEYSLN